MLRSMGRRVNALMLALVMALFAGAPAFASGPDYSVLADAVDFDDIAPIVLAVGGALMVLFVIIKGVRIALSMVRGG